MRWLWNRLKRRLQIALWICGTILLLSPQPSSAKPEPTTEPTPIEQGTPAPFSGILLPVDDAAALWEKLEVLEAKLALEEKRCDARLSVEDNRCFQQLLLAKNICTEKTDAAKAALKSCETQVGVRPWWEEPAVLLTTGIVLGVVGGIAAATGVALLLQTNGSP